MLTSIFAAPFAVLWGIIAGRWLLHDATHVVNQKDFPWSVKILRQSANFIPHVPNTVYYYHVGMDYQV